MDKEKMKCNNEKVIIGIKKKGCLYRLQDNENTAARN